VTPPRPPGDRRARHEGTGEWPQPSLSTLLAGRARMRPDAVYTWRSRIGKRAREIVLELERTATPAAGRGTGSCIATTSTRAGRLWTTQSAWETSTTLTSGTWPYE